MSPGMAPTPRVRQPNRAGCERRDSPMAMLLRWDLSVTSQEVEEMARAVDDRAADLAAYADPRDYDGPDGVDQAVRRLEGAPKVLRYLAERLGEAAAS